EELGAAWAALCDHTVRHASELVLLPELAMVDALWESPRFDAERWGDVEARSAAWRARLPELGAAYVVGTRPVRAHGKRLNQAYLWSPEGVAPLRSKHYMPEEPGNWEATWF